MPSQAATDASEARANCAESEAADKFAGANTARVIAENCGWIVYCGSGDDTEESMDRRPRGTPGGVTVAISLDSHGVGTAHDQAVSTWLGYQPEDTQPRPRSPITATFPPPDRAVRGTSQTFGQNRSRCLNASTRAISRSLPSPSAAPGQAPRPAERTRSWSLPAPAPRSPASRCRSCCR